MEYSVNTMRLIKEDILNIDRYLIKKGIKYMDVRYELIDHLVSKYEAEENYPDLESFLRKRVAWCRKVAEKKAKSMYLGYQKALLKRVLTFFKMPIFYLMLLGWLSFLFYIEEQYGIQTLVNVGSYLLVGIIIFQFADFFLVRFHSAKDSKMLSVTTLFNIYSLPHFFLYFLGILGNQFEAYAYFGPIYFSIGILVNVAALMEVYFKRKRALKDYDFLKTYFV